MDPNAYPNPTDEAILSNLLPSPNKDTGIELVLSLPENAKVILPPVVRGQGQVTA